MDVLARTSEPIIPTPLPIASYVCIADGINGLIGKMTNKTPHDDTPELLGTELAPVIALGFALQLGDQLLGDLPEALSLAAEALLGTVTRFGVGLECQPLGFRSIWCTEWLPDLALARDAETHPPAGAGRALKQHIRMGTHW
jgi:hypothetical protein